MEEETRTISGVMDFFHILFQKAVNLLTCSFSPHFSCKMVVRSRSLIINFFRPEPIPDSDVYFQLCIGRTSMCGCRTLRGVK